MNRFAVGACAVALCTLPALGPTPAAAPESRSLPMHFEWRVEGPADSCANECRTWVSAVGAITADTPRDFEAFAKTRNLKGVTLVLDSDGGSVIGALALGRSVRKFAMITSVGKTVDLPSADTGERRAKLMPRAYCESMCAFVLLAGVERHVPSEARVLVHQIWLGDRRDDPTAANYSAEDLVLVQRDIGRLAQYTVEMGGTIDFLETALKIPPWEPMRLLSREELRGMKIVTNDDGPAITSATRRSSPGLSGGSRVGGNERSWTMSDKSGRALLARSHPLTVEGEDIGTFELSLGCAVAGTDYPVTYVEQRRAVSAGHGAEALVEIELSLSGKSVPLKVVSTQPGSRPNEVRSVATGSIPADLVRAFADSRSRSLTVETTSEDTATAIRIGNAGISRAFPQFTSSCSAGAVAAIPTPVRAGLRREAEAQPR